jgi:hypothetical protein
MGEADLPAVWTPPDSTDPAMKDRSNNVKTGFVKG